MSVSEDDYLSHDALGLADWSAKGRLPRVSCSMWRSAVPSADLAALDAPPTPLRVALCLRPPNGAAVQPDCVMAAKGAATLCEGFGHRVEAADPGIDWADGYADAFNIIFGVGMLSNIRAMARRKGEL